MILSSGRPSLSKDWSAGGASVGPAYLMKCKNPNTNPGYIMCMFVQSPSASSIRFVRLRKAFPVLLAEIPNAGPTPGTVTVTSTFLCFMPPSTECSDSFSAVGSYSSRYSRLVLNLDVNGGRGNSQ